MGSIWRFPEYIKFYSSYFLGNVGDWFDFFAIQIILAHQFNANANDILNSNDYITNPTPTLTSIPTLTPNPTSIYQGNAKDMAEPNKNCTKVQNCEFCEDARNR